MSVAHGSLISAFLRTNGGGVPNLPHEFFANTGQSMDSKPQAQMDIRAGPLCETTSRARGALNPVRFCPRLRDAFVLKTTALDAGMRPRFPLRSSREVLKFKRSVVLSTGARENTEEPEGAYPEHSLPRTRDVEDSFRLAIGCVRSVGSALGFCITMEKPLRQSASALANEEKSCCLEDVCCPAFEGFPLAFLLLGGTERPERSQSDRLGRFSPKPKRKAIHQNA